MKKLSLLFLVLIGVGFAQFETAFIHHEGGGTVGAQFHYWSYNTMKYKDMNTNPNLNRAINHYQFKLIGQYSILEKLSAIVVVPVSFVESSKQLTSLYTTFNDTLPFSTKFGLGNVMAGAKYKFLHQKGWLFSTSFAAEFKTGNYDNKTGLKTAMDCYTFTPTIHVAKTVRNLFYANIDGGASLRTDNHAHSWRLYTEIGFNFFREQIWLKAALDINQSINSDIVNRPNNLQTGLFLNNQSYSALKLVAEFCHYRGFGINAGANIYIGGDFIPNITVAHASLFYRWKYDLNAEPPYTITPKTKS